MPKIQGSAVELHPSLIIFVLIIGGAIAGLLGAILAIPITAAGRDVYRYLFRRLSDAPPAAEEARLRLRRSASSRSPRRHEPRSHTAGTTLPSA